MLRPDERQRLEYFYKQYEEVSLDIYVALGQNTKDTVETDITFNFKDDEVCLIINDEFVEVNVGNIWKSLFANLMVL